jgi:hypothetical protein
MEVTENKAPDIFNAIMRMTKLLAAEGISKNQGGTSSEVKYKFRGIDDIRNAIAPLQEQCNLVIYPSMVERTEKERTTKSGGFALQTVVKVDMHFVSTVDGSEIVTRWENEALDYSDKGTGKAISQCFKNACINTFNIPTEGEQDADSQSHEIKSTKRAVFETPENRKLFETNCVTSFTNASTLVTLKDIEQLNHEKLVLLRNSDDDADRAVAAKCLDAYQAAYKRLNEAAKAPAKPTVDALVSKSKGTSIIHDEIPF